MDALWSIEDLHPLHIDRHWEREVYILNMARTATFCTAMNQANFIQPLFSAFQLWTKSNATPSCVFPLDFCFVLSHLMHFFMNSWTLLHNWNGQNFTCGCFFCKFQLHVHHIFCKIQFHCDKALMPIAVLYIQVHKHKNWFICFCAFFRAIFDEMDPHMLHFAQWPFLEYLEYLMPCTLKNWQCYQFDNVILSPIHGECFQ